MSERSLVESEGELDSSACWIDVPAYDSGHFEGFLQLPKGGTGPGLLLLQEIFGVNAHIRQIAMQYAARGYVVLAPDIFWRISPRIELGYFGSERTRANTMYDQLDKDLAVADVVSAAAKLRRLPQVRGKVGAVGFCLGGWLTYAAAAERAIDIGVSYYGGGIQDTLHLAAEISAPMQFHFGGLDSAFPVAMASQVGEAFRGRCAEVHVYPDADHGFNCWERDTYHPASFVWAQERALRFLKQHR